MILVDDAVCRGACPARSWRCRLGTGAVALLGWPSRRSARRFGGIPSGLPPLHLPAFRPELLGGLIVPAVTVAMLGAIESLMSAMVADRMSGDRHNSNIELVAQGLANIASPLFGGLPATGAIARTATNIRSGARTPVAGIVHALTLLVILLFAAPLARHIPLAVLAAILMVVAYNMGEWREIPELLPADEDRHRRLARHVRADRVRRSDGRGRRRHGARGAAVHPPRRRYDDRHGRDRRLRPGGARAHPAAQGHPAVRARSSASTDRSCSAPPTSCG